jgi:hypothetical protein
VPRISLNTLAMLVSILSGDRISKQGVWKRLGCEAVVFLADVLFAALRRTFSGALAIRDEGVFSHFHRVLIQDSTYLRLPDHLANLFSGSRNQTGRRSSHLKIQLIYDLMEEKIKGLGLSGYTRNDQEASRDIFAYAGRGDLILRDLGYFSVPVFRELSERGIYFLSRLRNRMAVFDGKTGERLDLLAQLQKHKTFDQCVLLGSKDRLPIRLIAVPVPETLANERRRKAKMNRDKRQAPSRSSLQLLGWELFVTNVDETVWSAETAARVYFMRWRVEVVFKVWKSHLRITEIPRGSKPLILSFILARLLYLVWFHTSFDRLNTRSRSAEGPWISMQKFADFTNVFSAALALSPDIECGDPLFDDIMQTLCAYEKRRGRNNHYQALRSLS